MDDKEKGFYNKFQVRRIDGSSQYGGKHFSCGYFVIDLDHDRFAAVALAAYADACESEYPKLALDLRERISKL